MIIPDVNLLVYAYNKSDPNHTASRRWWESCMNGSEIVGLPWIVNSGFIRIMTHLRIMKDPMHVKKATELVQTWISHPKVVTINPGPAFGDLFLGFLNQLGTGGNLTTDTQIAALAVENQATLHSCDMDFARFEGLRWVNPLRNPAKSKNFRDNP